MAFFGYVLVTKFTVRQKMMVSASNRGRTANKAGEELQGNPQLRLVQGGASGSGPGLG